MDPLKKLGHDGRNAAYALVVAIVRYFPGRRGGGGTLVLRLDAIGDFLIWLASGASEVAAFAREDGPAVLLANKEWASLARELDLFDEVWPIEPDRFENDFGYRLSVQWAIRRRAFSRVIQPRSARAYFLEDAIVRASATPCAIGNAGDHRNISGRRKRRADRWYNRMIPLLPGLPSERERNLAFMRGLIGIPGAVARLPVLPRRPPPFELPTAYIVVAPSAGWAGRRWPLERFAMVADTIFQRHGWRTVIVGSYADAALCAKLAALIGESALQLAGRAGLVDAIGVVGGARLVLANESSMAHLGALLGVPTVTILGGGHFGLFMPYASDDPMAPASVPVWVAMPCYSCNWRCVFKVPPNSPVPCIDAVQISAVLAHIDAKVPGRSPAGGSK